MMTPDEILAHVVVDPAAWKAHARIYATERWARDRAYLERLQTEAALAGDDPLAPQINGRVAALRAQVEAGSDHYFNAFLNAKVEAHRKAAEAAAAQPDYKNRSEREAEEEAALQAKLAAHAQLRAEAQAQRKAEFDAAVAAAVDQALAARSIQPPTT